MSLYSAFLARLEPIFHRAYGARKRELFRSLGGRVLEIGAGTGLNHAYLPASTEWLPLEPERDLAARIRARHPTIQVLESPAEAIPLPDASVDAVISSLVLCSVDSPGRALSEVLRVLRPGGCLVVLEHVAGQGWERRLQHWVQPLWTCLTGGCHPDRDTERSLRATGFDRLELEPFRMVLPHISGKAWKA